MSKVVTHAIAFWLGVLLAFTWVLITDEWDSRQWPEGGDR